LYEPHLGFVLFCLWEAKTPGQPTTRPAFFDYASMSPLTSKVNLSSCISTRYAEVMRFVSPSGRLIRNEPIAPSLSS